MRIITLKKAGFSLIEFMAASSISAIIMSSLYSFFGTTTSTYHDLQIQHAGIQTVEAVNNIVVNELKMIGSGIPFIQPNFEPGDSLEDENGNIINNSEVTCPVIFEDSSASSISYRLNELGRQYFLPQNFNPKSSLEIQLDSIAGLYVGDDVYISNRLAGLADGFKGTIESIDSNSKTIILKSNYLRSRDAQFPVGSVLEPVTTITLSSSNGQITRDDGFGPVSIIENASFALQYKDSEGAEIDLSLEEGEGACSDLASVDFTVIYNGDRTLFRNGNSASYNATVTKSVIIK